MKDTLKLIIAGTAALALLLNSLAWLTGRADWVVPILAAHASSMPAQSTHDCGEEEKVNNELDMLAHTPKIEMSEPVMTLQEALRIIQVQQMQIAQMQDGQDFLSDQLAELDVRLSLMELEQDKNVFADPCGLESVECPGENSVLAR